MEFKDVVVIGNGPSGITLSYMLSGNWPFYNGEPHPIEFLHNKLEENKDKSLIEQDLEYLSEGLEGRSFNPVSVLFDTLTHPQADLGDDNPSVLKWQQNPSYTIEHVILGKGLPGGAWQKMDGSTLTISFGSWMELAALRIRYWNETTNRFRLGQSGLKQKRATVKSVANYYEDYVDYHGLNQYFINDAIVTSVCKITDEAVQNFYHENNILWKVSGHFLTSSPDRTEKFNYITPNVALATGNSDCYNKLDVEGEDLPFVLYSLGQLEELISRGELSATSGNLLIVGAGLSAADAVIAARFHNISTLHVFRRSVCDNALIFNKLPENIYPEYHKVHQMMQESNQELYEDYKAFSQHRVRAIKPNGEVILVSCENENRVVQVSHVLILVGMHPDLSFLSDAGKKLPVHPDLPINSRTNPIKINSYSHECVNEPGLYAIGPLVGDNFVRFVQGGCLAMANHLWKKRLEK